MMDWAKESLEKVEQSRAARLDRPATLPNDWESILKISTPTILAKSERLP